MSSQSVVVEPLPEELASLPFDFTNLEVYQNEDRRTLYADWETEGQPTLPLQKFPNQSWELYDDNSPVTWEHWHQRYPGAEHVLDLDTRYLSGRFNEKIVNWSRTQRCWTYRNNRPVDFTAAPSSQPTPREPSPSGSGNASEEEAAVSELLERTEKALHAATSSLRQLSAPPTPQTVPGGLPTTPTPASTWESFIPTPSSPPRLDTPQRLPSPEPSPRPPSSPTSSSSSSEDTPPPSTTAAVPATHVTTTANPTQTMSTRPLGAAPEPFDGKAENAENFWTALESYYLLNTGIFNTEHKKIMTALTYFKAGTSAAEWARERQKTAFAAAGGVDFGTWAAFKKDFSDHFIPAESILESTQKMHTMRMGNREFNDFYQEWSTHASRSGVDDHTKMYAFRQALPQALHNKILGVSPQPTTLAGVVEHTRQFDHLWQVYQKSTTPHNDTCPQCTRAVAIEEGSSTQINYANLEAAEGKISKEEKERRYKAGLCFYCGKGKHLAKECHRKKNKGKSKFPPRNTQRRDAKAQAFTTEDTNDPDKKVSPPYEENSMTLSRIYPATNRFDIICPASAPIDLDF